MTHDPLLIEGLSPDQWLSLPADQLRQLAFCGRPIVFRAGTATVLGEFSMAGAQVNAALAHIDGGGEGVLPALMVLIDKAARRIGAESIAWTVHAARCAEPNPKLRPLLERRGFALAGDPGAEVYRKRVSLAP